MSNVLFSTQLRVAALLMGVLAAPFAHADLLVFMKIDGIAGESTVVGHLNEIVLSSYSQTFGTRNCSRVIAVKSLDRASPALISRAAANTVVTSVVISMRKAGEAQRDFFTATLDGVQIDKIDLVEQGSQILETLTLKPRGIHIEYRPQDDKGGLLPPIVSDLQCF